MASTKTRTRTVRILNATADYFEGKALNKAIEGIYELISTKKIEFDNENLKIVGNESVHTLKKSEKFGASPNKDLEEIDSMASFFGVTTKELLKGVCDGLMDGNLTLEKGKVVGVPEIELDGFKEVCHDVNVEPQEMINKVTGLIEKGRI